MDEIERKFLTTSYHLAVVRTDEVSPDYSHRLWLNALGSTSIEVAHIQQIYLDLSQNEKGEIEREERIRRKVRLNDTGEPIDTLFYFTTKFGKGVRRKEREIEITQANFEYLAGPSPNNKPIINKLRTTIELRGVTIEIDRYLGPLGGLCVSEVEFANLASAANFEPESFRDILGKELSGQQEFSNVNLALTQQIPGSITLPKHLAPALQPPQSLPT